MDSLMNELITSNNFYRTDTISYLMEPFYRYKSIDGSQSNDIYIDSIGELSDYIGLTMVHKEYDPYERVTKRIGYNLKGNYYLWDYSPIVHWQYATDTIIKDNYNFQYVLEERIETIKDSNDREIETLKFDKDLRLSSRITKTFNDSLNEVLIKRYDSNGNYMPDKLGMSISLKRFDPDNQTSFVEEYFYDSKMKLIDGDHNNLASRDGLELNYSQIKKKEEGDWVTIYYNSEGEIVCEAAFGELIIIK